MSPKILVIEAHPDDETVFVGVLYKTVHNLNGIVDLVVITNGEGGYVHSELAEPIYGIKLTDESIGRQHLPRIRKQELMNGGKIIGIRNYFFLDQVDDAYTKDVEIPRKLWDLDSVRNSLQKIIIKGEYDFIIVLLPTARTHGHHKAATLLTLECVSILEPNKRPIILGSPDDAKIDPATYQTLAGFPLTKVDQESPVFEFNRMKGFGTFGRLNYNIIARWVESEHKSQGGLLDSSSGKIIEQYFYFDLNGKNGLEKTQQLFEKLNT